MSPEEAVKRAIAYFRQVQQGETFGGLFVEGLAVSKDYPGGWDVTLSYTIRTAGDAFDVSGLPPPRRRSVVVLDGEGNFCALHANAP